MVPALCPVSRDHETEMFLHRREIAVIVQQRVAMLDAECADDEVGRLADRDAQLSQLAIVPGGARGEIGIQKRHKSIPAHSAFDARSMSFIPGALKNLEQDEIADQERFPTRGGFQFGSGGVRSPRKIGDPDGAIDENHAGVAAALTHFVQVAFPPQSLEVRERLDLLAYPDQQSQALFDRGSFGRQARCLHGLGQQFVVDFDIGPHPDDPTAVYRSINIYTSIGPMQREINRKHRRRGGGSREGYGVDIVLFIVRRGPAL